MGICLEQEFIRSYLYLRPNLLIPYGYDTSGSGLQNLYLSLLVLL